MKMASAKPETNPEATSRNIRVCVVEDDHVVREQLVHQLSRAPGFTCVSSHRSAEAALEEIPRHQPDVVLMDINLPRMSGIDCVRVLKGQLPNTQYVMLTVYEDADVIFKSLLAGAVGYLLKGRTGSGNQVLEAVRDAARGGSPLNSLIARKIVQYFHHQPSRAGTEQPLSTREREVLELLSKGLPYKEIADLLGVNIETVRKHCHNIYEKLQVSSRTEAVVKFLGR
ncbi:MAG TPA: response regulator transcription factor [Verrucomicrobiae bacterium]|nr:response regulator transcription factor [Verrucomicrobiae bacterium]